ncbi:MAG: SRPBCC family protein [Rhodocyclaceae bacterium]|nr:SRPBCC family protein [Rhodocyclaceae bacterium]
MPRPPFPILLSLLLTAALATLPVAHASQDEDGVNLNLNIDGDEVHLDISAVIEARPREVWAVFTDFEHMAEFVSNLKSSQVIARPSSNSMTVEQHGRAGSGLLSFSLDSIREIQIKPFESIRSRLLSGSMRKFDGITRLSEEGGKTRVSYHSDAISGVWIPPVIGRKLIEDEAREQFSQMLQEVMRRKQMTASSNR